MTTLNEKLNELPPERRKRVQERAQALRVKEGLRYSAPSFLRPWESRPTRHDSSGNEIPGQAWNDDG